ncbi:MAG: hypothetical protein V3W34_20725 [Phycisphaerae bacterium]
MCVAPRCWAEEGSVKCLNCHVEQADELAGSVHKAMGCQECHSGDASYTVSSEGLAEYLQRGSESPLVFDHGPSFSGKPARAEVPSLCGGCHADVQRMNPYGLRTDQLARYWTSGHGKTLKGAGDERVAVCVDCHGWHDILPGRDPQSRTNPLNVPDTCGRCHADAALMAEFDLAVEVVSEYRASIHGKLLFEQGDTGAPTCATCHGNHSAVPPGFATVGAVCGQCHQHAAAMFATSIHASQSEFKGCVQCHGGGEDRHFHLIQRITRPPSLMIRHYARLMMSQPGMTPEQITETIHPGPRAIITQALSSCMECHEELEDDESLPKLFALLDEIADGERYYVRTANLLQAVGQGVLLVDNQRFLLEEAKTHLIELGPIQHTLDNTAVAEKVAELNAVCDQVNAELGALISGLRWRFRALIPIWVFATLFSIALYAKYKQLKRVWVKPLTHKEAGVTDADEL